MSKEPPNRSHEFVTLDELASELFTPGVVKDFSAMVFEPKPLKMRWAMLAMVIGWFILNTTASVLLFLVTRSELALAPSMVAAGVTPSLIRTISRFLFWGPADYKLKALEMTLRAQKRGTRPLRQFPQT